jgi:hypothetical protein
MIKKTQKSCDKLLSPIVKKLNPTCLFWGRVQGCTKDTQVAHHHCHKSKSLILRYDIKNLVNFCNHCHLMLHWNESYWASKVVEIKGLAWFRYIEKTKNKELRYPDYDNIYQKLSKLLND